MNSGCIAARPRTEKHSPRIGRRSLEYLVAAAQRQGACIWPGHFNSALRIGSAILKKSVRAANKDHAVGQTIASSFDTQNLIDPNRIFENG